MKEPDYLISTPENVDLHLELAGLGCRIWAAFIDTIILYLTLAVVAVTTVVSFIILENLNLPANTKTTIYYWILFLVIFLMAAIAVGYFIYFEGTWKGQTPGKRLIHIRVIEANGQPVSWSSVFIRNLLRVVDMVAMIGVIFMIFNSHEKRIGDLAAGTLVIRERPTQLSTSNVKVKSTMPPSSFMDAGQISPDEYHLLVSFLKRRTTLNKDSRLDLAKQLSDFFRHKLSPDLENEPDEEILEKIYLVYNNKAVLPDGEGISNAFPPTHT